MLNIGFTPKDEKLAQTMQNDLAAASLRLEHSILLVLLNQSALADDNLLKAIKTAENDKQIIAPVLLEKVALPENLKGLENLELSNGYDKNKLIAFVKSTDISQEVKNRNRRLLFYVGSAALLVFAISIASLVSGIVAAPNAEFATENALQDAQIETVVAPELEAARPRTTEDALAFPATVEAARRQLRPFLIGTATAIPLERQSTQEAMQTQAVQTSTAILEQANAEATPEATEE